MQFSLLEPISKQVLVFPVNPESVNIASQAKTLQYSPVALGDIEIPRGRVPTKVSWEGILPGLNRSLPGVPNQNPNDIVNILKKWSTENWEGSQNVRLIISETPWNLLVFISDFNATHSGGHGDIYYSITLTEWRPLIIQETAAKPAPKRPTTTVKQRTYTVKKGDNLWNIAKKYTGKGARWTEMWAINKTKSRSKNPNLIYPGEVFTIPSGW